MSKHLIMGRDIVATEYLYEKGLRAKRDVTSEVIDHIATQAAAIEALEAKYDQAQKRVEELFEIIADCDDSVAKFKLDRIEEAG